LAAIIVSLATLAAVLYVGALSGSWIMAFDPASKGLPMIVWFALAFVGFGVMVIGGIGSDANCHKPVPSGSDVEAAARSGFCMLSMTGLFLFAHIIAQLPEMEGTPLLHLMFTPGPWLYIGLVAGLCGAWGLYRALRGGLIRRCALK